MTTGESADLQCRLESREWSVQSVQTNPANILLVSLKKSGCPQLIAVQCKLVRIQSILTEREWLSDSQRSI
eukprot:m.574705 g.574705  ORF g.574705 m.574705 type:complete len:71 (+) comp57883_c0_seq106:86-298(+)